MTNSQRLAAVRRGLDRWLEKQQCDGDVEIRDSILIRDGFYVGRQFQLGTFRAVWFMEEDEVKIHDASGALVAKLDTVDIDLVAGTDSQPKLDTLTEKTDQENVISLPLPWTTSVNERENRRAA